MSAEASPKLSVSIRHWSEWPRVAPIWARLVHDSPGCSFFLTETWIETWLEIFGGRLSPSILLFDSDGETVGASLLVKTKSTQALLPIKRISFNASGEPAADTTYGEFNDLLCRKGWDAAVAEALFDHLSEQDWDEITLDGFTPGVAYDVLAKGFEGLDREDICHPSYYVDLAAVRKSGLPFEMTLGRTHRKHLRQNIRYHSEAGELRMEAATSVPAALSMLDELAGFSQKRWASRGKHCMFSSPRFVAFHRSLIAKCYPKGTVQILRLAAGAETIGVVYNLIHLGKVYFYQCGYRYSEDKRLSPGIVTLSKAIQFCVEAGFDDYDFLSGEAKYKRSLSTGARNLVWAAFRRSGPKLRLLRALRQIKLQLSETHSA